MASLRLLLVIKFTNIFNVTNFDMRIFQKTVRSSEKCSGIISIEAATCHRMEPLRFVLYNLDLHFHGQNNFQLCIGYNKCADSRCSPQIFLDSHGCRREVALAVVILPRLNLTPDMSLRRAIANVSILYDHCRADIM